MSEMKRYCLYAESEIELPSGAVQGVEFGCGIRRENASMLWYPLGKTGVVEPRLVLTRGAYLMVQDSGVLARLADLDRESSPPLSVQAFCTILDECGFVHINHLE
jgi:hypothetical protein